MNTKFIFNNFLIINIICFSNIITYCQCNFDCPPVDPSECFGSGGSGAYIIPNLWLGVDDDWGNISNWSLGSVPDNTSLVEILDSSSPIIISNAAIVSGLEIATDNILKINPGGSITIEGLVDNDGSIVIESNNMGLSGSFIDYCGLGGTGTFEFNRDIVCIGFDPNDPEDPIGWHYLSAPVNNAVTGDLVGYFVKEWQEPIQMFYDIDPYYLPCDDPDHIPSLFTVPLNVGQGYSIHLDVNYDCPPCVVPSTEAIIEFGANSSGVSEIAYMPNLNTGSFSIPFTKSTGLYDGWNLIGNPYPSGLDMSLIAWPPELVAGAAYYDGCAGNYVYWAPGLGPYSMAPTLGFFVEAIGSGVLELTNNERAHYPDWFWKADANNLLTIKATGNKKSDLAYIRFDENTTNGFDRMGDFHKLIATTTGLPQIYTSIKDEKLAVNSLPETETVPLAFTSVTSGRYTIEAIELSDFKMVCLVDKAMGIITDLVNSSYSFNYKNGDNPDRFVIRFGDISTDTEEEGFVIYSNQGNIVVYNINDLTGDVYIFNVVGQLISSKKLDEGLNNITLDNVDGYYIVNVRTGESVVNKKVYIH